jgi:hypothetical protein
VSARVVQAEWKRRGQLEVDAGAVGGEDRGRDAADHRREVGVQAEPAAVGNEEVGRVEAAQAQRAALVVDGDAVGRQGRRAWHIAAGGGQQHPGSGQDVTPH